MVWYVSRDLQPDWSRVSSVLENPNIADVMLPVDRIGVEAAKMTPQPAEPPYGREPHVGTNVASLRRAVKHSSRVGAPTKCIVHLFEPTVNLRLKDTTQPVRPQEKVWTATCRNP